MSILRSWLGFWIVFSLSIASPTRGEKPFEPRLTETDSSPYSLRRDVDRPRNFVLSPLLSFFIPGLDQLVEQQVGAGFTYLGIAAAGMGYMFATAGLPDKRHMSLGAEAIVVSGGLSLFHAFRTAAKSQQQAGNFLFLKEEETPGQLALAPFRLSYLGRQTTWIPLIVGVGIGFLGLSPADRVFQPQNFTFADGFFSLTTSYQAGLWEEAVFRGWMMPVFMHYTGSPFWSNFLSSAIFAAAHYREGFIPWPQFALGMYLGYVSQQNNWTLGQSIFIHSWYDVLIFLAAYLKDGSAASVQFPTLHFRF